MGDLGTPHLLLAAPTSAHHFTLKPSQARALQNADIVFWIGPGMEQPLTKALATLAADAQSVALDDSAGLVLFDFDDDGHDDHGTKDKHDGTSAETCALIRISGLTRLMHKSCLG